MSKQETGQTVGVDEVTRRGNGSGETMSQQEINAFVSRMPLVFNTWEITPRIRFKGGILNLVGKLRKMDFGKQEAEEYATSIVSCSETVAPDEVSKSLLEAKRKASLAQLEGRYDAGLGQTLQPEVVLYEDSRRRS